MYSTNEGRRRSTYMIPFQNNSSYLPCLGNDGTKLGFRLGGGGGATCLGLKVFPSKSEKSVDVIHYFCGKFLVYFPLGGAWPPSPTLSCIPGEQRQISAACQIAPVMSDETCWSQIFFNTPTVAPQTGDQLAPRARRRLTAPQTAVNLSAPVAAPLQEH